MEKWKKNNKLNNCMSPGDLSEIKEMLLIRLEWLCMAL